MYPMASSSAAPHPSNLAAPSVYAASVNPPRRAKLQALASTSLPTLLPSPPGSTSPSPNFSINVISASSNSEQVQQPRKKRGRKPIAGASSRAGREAARKANHSRIEKARRGKINNALQDLKNLIPTDFALTRESEGYEEEDAEDASESPSSSTKKESGKKAIADREFKLDILERTVLFVRALLQRVSMDDQPGSSDPAKRSLDGCQCQCHRAYKDNTNAARKRRALEQEGNKQGQNKKKRQRIANTVTKEHERLSRVDDDDESCADSENDEVVVEDAETASSRPTQDAKLNSIHLPSISELLSSPERLVPVQARTGQLPSPSLSPLAFPSSHHHVAHTSTCSAPQHRQEKPSYVSWSLSPSPPPRTIAAKITSAKGAEQPSCPMDMSSLPTPPTSTKLVSSPAMQLNANTQAPAFRLPSSALDSRDKGVTGSSGIATDTVAIGETDAEDGGARTASLALLQMRNRSYSRGSTSSSVGVPLPAPTNASKNAASPVTARLTLTPGSLLGIHTSRSQ